MDNQETEVTDVTVVQDAHPVGTLPAPKATSLLQAITAAASNPAMDIEKMERLWKMHEAMVRQEQETAFNAAMARAQHRCIAVAANCFNDQTKKRYADLMAINAVINPVITEEGLSVSFDTADSGNPLLFRTVATVRHSAGFSKEYHFDLPLDNVGSGGKVNKTMVHALGSTTSYARRYLVNMIFNLSSFDDDDGNAGGEGKVGGLPASLYDAYVERINACKSHDIAKSVWQEISRSCVAVQDTEAQDELRAKVIARREIIQQEEKDRSESEQSTTTTTERQPGEEG